MNPIAVAQCHLSLLHGSALPKMPHDASQTESRQASHGLEAALASAKQRFGRRAIVWWGEWPPLTFTMLLWPTGEGLILVPDVPD